MPMKLFACVGDDVLGNNKKICYKKIVGVWGECANADKKIFNLYEMISFVMVGHHFL